MFAAVRRLAVATALAALMAAAVSGVAGAVAGVLIRPGGAMSIRGTLRTEGMIECNVTYNGSFETRFVSLTVEGTSVGRVTELRTECAGGNPPYYRIAAVLNLPWTIRWRKLDGVAPRFAIATALSEATLQVVGVSLQLRPVSAEFGLPTCLWGGPSEAIELTPALRLVRGVEYTLAADTGSFSLASSATEGICRELGPLPGQYAIEPPSPAQTLVFTAGGEVREALTPNPVEFGVVEPEGLAQRSLTLTTTRGGRVEDVFVTAGRYFTVTDPNGCRGSVLPEGGRCTVTVIVSAPSEAGTAVSDTVTARVGGRRIEGALRAST